MRYEFPPEVVLKLNGYIQNGELTPTLAGNVKNGVLKPLLNGYVSRGVKAAEIDENGHLLLTLTDNTVLDLGSAVGPPGEKGDKGDTGERGNRIWYTDRMPDQMGNTVLVNDLWIVKYRNGPFYPGDVAICTEVSDGVASWSRICSMVGEHGSIWHVGSGRPQGTVAAEETDLYLDTSTAQVWQFRANASGVLEWVSVCNIKGSKGDKGADGAPGKNGVSPTITTSKSGKVTTVTVTDATGEHSFEILDGEDGTGSGGDMTAAVYDQQGKAQDIFAYTDDAVSEVAQTASSAESTAKAAQREANSAYTKANSAASAASRAQSIAESKLSSTGNARSLVCDIAVYSQRSNLVAGEKLSSMFGKIYRYFADLKALAFKASVEKADLADDVPLLPDVTASDNGKFLRVVSGAWAAASVPDANGGAF